MDCNTLKDVFFDKDGKQNITCLDGTTLVFAQDQRYYFQRMEEGSDDSSVTVDRVTIKAGTSVAEGMRCLRQYLEDKNVPADETAAEVLGMPELLYEETNS